jgi:hypothetical protein
MPAYWPMPLWAGNNQPAEFVLRDSLGARVDLTGVQARLRIVWPGGGITVASGVDAGLTIPDQTDPGSRGSIVFAPTLEQSRQVPTGRLARYELELRDFLSPGLEITALAGPVVVDGGNNPDGVVA